MYFSSATHYVVATHDAKSKTNSTAVTLVLVALGLGIDAAMSSRSLGATSLKSIIAVAMDGRMIENTTSTTYV